MRKKPRLHPAVNVTISTLNAGEVKHGTFSSWNDLNRYDIIGEDHKGGCQHVLRGGTIELLTGPRVAEGRSQIVDAFLTTENYKDSNWLLMIDSDMTFEADILCQLLGHAYNGNKKADANNPECFVIGALCFAGGRSRMYPTLYRGATRIAFDGSEQIVPEPIEDYPRNELVKVMGTGAAFLLVHRKVLMHMKLPHPDGFGTDMHGQPNPHPWFVEGLSKGVQFGEDIAFCMRANALGYGVYVHTGVQTGHLKTLELNEELWDEYNERNKPKKKELKLP